jgi:hypothetical protein
LFKGYLELESHVKVVFDRSLVSSSNKNHFTDASGISFFNGVLDQGLVNHRQHFFRLRLGRW